jgi:NTF2-related export protein 1/2
LFEILALIFLEGHHETLLSFPPSQAMATLTETDYARVSTDAGEHFVDAYYAALNGNRSQIISFYIPTTPGPSPGRGLPHISYNGELIQDASTFQDKFEKQMPWTHFEPQSLNVHVMNPSLTPMEEGKSKKDAERNMSLVVQVSGYVRLQERKEGPMRGFSDSFVLVPNKEEVGGRGTGKQDHGRRWLIQSQNFRFVV